MQLTGPRGAESVGPGEAVGKQVFADSTGADNREVRGGVEDQYRPAHAIYQVLRAQGP